MTAFDRLDRRIQKWIFQQGWPSLREIQAKSVEPILACDSDVLISASTAAGKTEAAFLPACTAIADQQEGFGILYLSPLKSLINDQYRRLELLCEAMGMSVTPWHGDANQSAKKKMKKNPSGILLITPESLEAMLMNHGGWASEAFDNLKYIIIDEFHALIGTPRSQQMMSLLNRLDHLIQRQGNPVPRIALSATLGDLEKIPSILRPNASLPCKIITSEGSGGSMKLLLKGYVNPVPQKKQPENPGAIPETAKQQIASEVYRVCRGGSHLIFANSRRSVESYSMELSGMCEKALVPNEFFPHHGSLSKEYREELEARFQKENLPTSGVCTTTMEMGVDIGKVDSTIQIETPHSVSSLRQRAGRSGRRGGNSILRLLISETEINEDTGLIEKLRMNTIQSMAIVRVMLVDKWYEPADSNKYHFSTLFHQIIAVISQWGGVRADDLFVLLCRRGPFQKVSVEDYKALLSHMGATGMIQQLSSGELVIGLEGEKLRNHYTFYAVFSTPEEFRIIAGNKTLGTIPVDSPLMPNQYIIFAGKGWIITEIDEPRKVILVRPAGGGNAPLFAGDSIQPHQRVREEMRRIYTEGDWRIDTPNGKVSFADETAEELANEGIMHFQKEGMGTQNIIHSNGDSYLFAWGDPKVLFTVRTLLTDSDVPPTISSNAVVMPRVKTKDIARTLSQILDNRNSIDPISLARHVVPREIEKFSEHLPDELLSKDIAQNFFDIEKTMSWIEASLKQIKTTESPQKDSEIDPSE